MSTVAKVKISNDVRDVEDTTAREHETALIYGLRRTGASTYTRTGAAYGKTFAFSSDTYAGWSDFDGADPFKLVRVKIHFDASLPNGYVESSVEGAANWETCTDDVFVRCPNAWIYEADNCLTGSDARVEKKVSMAPFTGAWRAFSTLKSDGTLWEPDYFYIGAYEMTKDGSKGASKSGQTVYTDAATSTLLAAARNTSQIACLCPEMAYEYMRIMMSIELGTDDLQNATDANGAKMPGFSEGIINWSMNATDQIQAASSGTTLSVTAACCGRYAVGQRIAIGTSYAASLVRTIVAIDATVPSITIDEAAEVTTSMMLNNNDFLAGCTDSILGHTGQPVLSSSKYPMKWRGIEQFYGGCGEAIADLRFLKNGDNTHRTWYCPKLLSMSGADVKTSDYVDTGIDSPGSDGYITCLGRGASYPQVSMPISVGGASTTYYGDYYWQNTSDNRMPRAGLNWDNVARLGGACRSCDSAASSARRYYGARLCFLP